MKIAMVGTGYVGLVSGVGFAEMGNDVICVDIDENKITKLKSGIPVIYEPGLEDLLKRNIKQERVKFTSDITEAVKESDIIFIAVGTPPGDDGKAELKYVFQVAEEVASHMTEYKILVNKSTVPVGTGEKVRNIVAETLKKRNLDLDFDVVSNPEFLKEGSAIDDFLKPDRIVIGTESQKSKDLMHRLYNPFVRNGHPIIDMDVKSSEMTKYAANSMLATKISFMNEVSRLCHKVGADVEMVRQGIGSDARIGFHFIYPGLGYGGSCFPKDVEAFMRTGEENNETMRILEAVHAVNKEQRNFFLNNVLEHFNNDVKGLTFAVWGLAFKPGTDDMREAPSIDIINALLERGAKVRAFDPVAIEVAKTVFKEGSDLEYIDTQYDVLNKADALLIITDWKPFREPNFDRIKSLLVNPLIFDGRNQYEPEVMKEYGFQYFSIGRKKV